MNDIDNLLDKYFNGVSSSEEEKRLKNYFNSSGILPEYEAYRPLFALFDTEKEIKTPPIILPEMKVKRLPLIQRIIILATGVAAVILLAVILFPFGSGQPLNTEYVVIVNGEKIADQYKARQYAESMFGEAKKIIEDSHQPFREAANIKEEMNAEKILREATEKIEYIKTNQQ